jgi:hypothetical protein
MTHPHRAPELRPPCVPGTLVSEFYSFVRSLQTYEQFLGKPSTLLLSADSALFCYLGRSQPGREEKLPGE